MAFQAPDSPQLPVPQSLLTTCVSTSNCPHPHWPAQPRQFLAFLDFLHRLQCHVSHSSPPCPLNTSVLPPMLSRPILSSPISVTSLSCSFSQNCLPRPARSCQPTSFQASCPPGRVGLSQISILLLASSSSVSSQVPVRSLQTFSGFLHRGIPHHQYYVALPH